MTCQSLLLAMMCMIPILDIMLNQAVEYTRIFSEMIVGGTVRGAPEITRRTNKNSGITSDATGAGEKRAASRQASSTFTTLHSQYTVCNSFPKILIRTRYYIILRCPHCSLREQTNLEKQGNGQLRLSKILHSSKGVF